MKKNLIHITLLLFAGNVFSQAPDSAFKIKGHIANLDKGTIYFNYFYNKSIVDSSKIVNGNFEFSGKIAYPVIGYLKLSNNLAIDHTSQYIFLEPTLINVALTDKPLSTVKVQGSKTHDELMAWKNADNDLKQIFSRVLNYTPDKKDTINLKNYEDSLVLYNKQKHLVEYDFFKSHPKSYVTPYLLAIHYHYYTVEELNEIYNNMGAILQASINGKYLLTNIAKIAGNSVGTMATNIISRDYINNKVFNLLSLRGKYVMIDFWGSWCQPCIKLLPDLVEENKKYKNKDIAFVSIADDYNANQNKCKEIVSKLGMNWVNLWSSQDKKDINGITTVYNVGVFPTFILIDPNGKVIAREDGEYGYFKCKALLFEKCK
ncbi:TlpA disulfide reductase family protein [Mucilaginibacter sp. OK098]|uniref:TlpA disulfide reductase family protein n=1 Tax=Mucilaginibacter sp. OK098 TaxID=1855297 RepID=UPI00091789D8|nr:TlpA disulfide reductase family protein [Mucilaginibacter sp. OK098]SHM81798.1 Thiol-disulfide isomerase or thioredoxin [Mucilaginibacter sp. OK098]